MVVVFFFQAEDGIRDDLVTGVQTCALPICIPATAGQEQSCATKIVGSLARQAYRRPLTDADNEYLMTYYDEGRKQGSFENRSEERRVGKEGRCRGSTDHERKKQSKETAEAK